MPIITFSGVSKEYASKTGVVHAVTDISLEIEEGEIIGLVGPNGAGKSTTVKMLCGILKPSNGKISVLGYTPHSDRKKLAMDIGVMFGNRSSLWYNTPAIESIKLMRDLYGISKKILKNAFRNTAKYSAPMTCWINRFGKCLWDRESK